MESIQHKKLQSHQNATKKSKECFKTEKCIKLSEYRSDDEMSRNLNRQKLDSKHAEQVCSISDAGYESEGGNDSEDGIFVIDLHGQKCQEQSKITAWDTEEDENRILINADAFLFSDNEDFPDIVSITSSEDDDETDIIDLEEH